jgi:hypothetical protein
MKLQFQYGDEETKKTNRYYTVLTSQMPCISFSVVQNRSPTTWFSNLRCADSLEFVLFVTTRRLMEDFLRWANDEDESTGR